MSKVIQFKPQETKKLTREQIVIARRDLSYDDESDLQDIYRKMMKKEQYVYLWTRCQNCYELQIIEAIKINNEYFFDCGCKRCKISIQMFMRELTSKELSCMQEYYQLNVETVSLESYINDKLCHETERMLKERKDSDKLC